MKIFLVGLPGSGKSFIGQRLAQAMNLSFIDLDEAIQKREGKPVSEIFSEKGQDYFRRVESAVLRSEIKKNDFVMATGGGTPCFYDNMDVINDNGVTIFLDTSISIIGKRLIDNQKTSRPLLAGETNIELALERLLNTRLPFYSQAAITIKEDTSISEIVQSINELK